MAIFLTLIHLYLHTFDGDKFSLVLSYSSRSSSRSSAPRTQPASVAHKPQRTDTQESVSSDKTAATDSQGSTCEKRSLGICVTCLPLRSSGESNHLVSIYQYFLFHNDPDLNKPLVCTYVAFQTP